MITLYYINEASDSDAPLACLRLSLEDAVTVSRSESGLATVYMAAHCDTRELADAFSIECYMAGMEEPPTVLEDVEDGGYCMILWDETLK